jgi:uncharacterized protein YbjT (DUF2867 family)
MYAIVGATGNTGQVIVKRLLDQGKQVRAIGRSADRLSPLVALGATGFVGSLENAAEMTRAFQGARAAYVMVPPNRIGLGYYRRVGEVLAQALHSAGVSHVVSLSSIGGHLAERAGHISDFHDLEQAINDVSDIGVVHLRAAFFMESLYNTISGIKKNGVMAGLLRPDLAVPRIATRDIGAAAAGLLDRLDFTGKTVRELLGQRDVTMPEVARVYGKAVGIEALPYSQTPEDQAERDLMQSGASKEMARHRIEMYAGFNSGFIRWLEERSAGNTTPTSIETFAAEAFAPRFRAA